jgi:hypothetical protein
MTITRIGRIIRIRRLLFAYFRRKILTYLFTFENIPTGRESKW